jgi:hypothetical protein
MSNTTAPTSAQPSTDQAVHTFIVCLPTNTDPAFLPALAHARLSTGGYTALGPVSHFPATTRRARRLIDLRKGFTCGGPIGLLDLDAMRRSAAAAAAQTWQYWNYVVAGTPIARPFWAFLDRHRADASRYPLEQAQRDYLTQPRVVAMRAFNALPQNGGILPTAELEAFQAGLTTYATLGQLAAVVADGVATADGVFLTPATTRLDDQLTYLHHANHHLASLPADQPIAAFAVTTAAQP